MANSHDPSIVNAGGESIQVPLETPLDPALATVHAGGESTQAPLETPLDSALATSIGAANQGTLSSISTSTSKNEVIRELLVSLAPTLTLLASMTLAEGASGISPPVQPTIISKEVNDVSPPPIQPATIVEEVGSMPPPIMPVATEIVTFTSQQLPRQTPIAESPFTASFAELAQSEMDQFDKAFKFGSRLIISGRRPFAYAQSILNNHINNVTQLMGPEWGEGMVGQVKELERLSNDLYNLRCIVTLDGEREAVARLKAEQEQAYNELNQFVTRRKGDVQSTTNSRHQVQQEYLKRQAAVREIEATIAKDRAILEEARRRIATGEKSLQVHHQEMTELVNRDAQLAQDLSTLQATLSVDEEKLASMRILSDEELRRKVAEEARTTREQAAAGTIAAIKALAQIE